MNKKRIGISLIILSAISALSNLTITGAIIGIQTSNILSIITISLFTIGIFLFFSRRNPKIITDREFGQKFKSLESKLTSKDKCAILDTSVIIDFYPEEVRTYMKEMQNSRGEVYVPQAVFDEIHDPKMIKALEDSGAVETAEYENFRDEAVTYLEQTTKAKLYREVGPFIRAALGIEKMPEGMTKRKVQPIREKLLPELLKRAKEDKFFIPSQYGGKAERFYERCNEYLEQHCKISPADTDVLASAIDEAKVGNHAIVGEKDRDLKEAIDIIKKQDPTTGNLIDYIETYKAKKTA